MRFFESIIRNMELESPTELITDEHRLIEAVYHFQHGIDSLPCTIVDSSSARFNAPLLRVKQQTVGQKRNLCTLLHDTMTNRYRCIISISGTSEKTSPACNYVRHQMQAKTTEPPVRIQNIYAEDEMFQISTLYDIPQDIIEMMDEIQNELLTIPFNGAYFISCKADHLKELYDLRSN